MLTPSKGMIIYGRSDATLNPGGVRMGTAELYRVLDRMTEVPSLVDNNKRGLAPTARTHPIPDLHYCARLPIVLWLAWTMALMCESSSLSFSLQDKYVQGVCSGALVLKPWSLTLLSPPRLQTLNGALKKVIKTKLRAECSPRHVPAAIFACPDIPYTLSGKVREHHTKLALCDLLTHHRPPHNPLPTTESGAGCQEASHGTEGPQR